MRRRTPAGGILANATGTLLLGCAGSAAPVPTAASTNAAVPAAEPAPGPQPSTSDPGVATAAPSTPAAPRRLEDGAVPSAGPGLPETPPPASTAALPASAASEPAPVEIKNIGLHIGGGANDAHSKAPFQAALEVQFDAFGHCYADHVSGGTITVGVDLYVPREGGAAEVRDFRTGAGGQAFEECMTAAFESARFDPPRAGPTLFSYSLRIRPAP